MNRLQQIALQTPQWSLEEFVDVANQLLPDFLPETSDADSRDRDSVNPRLVRYYTTQGLLNKPLKQGREARYHYRHLLQLLLLRRLLAEGYSTSSLGTLTRDKPDGDLEALLQGGVQLTVETANPALAFLASVRDRSPLRGAAPAAKASAPPPPAAPAPGNRRFAASRPAPAPPPSASDPEASRWYRQEILDGLELHMRDDFDYPASPHERELLLQLIAQRLSHLSQSRRSPHD